MLLLRYCGAVKVENHEGRGFGLAVFNYKAGVCGRMIDNNAFVQPLIMIYLTKILIFACK